MTAGSRREWSPGRSHQPRRRFGREARRSFIRRYRIVAAAARQADKRRAAYLSPKGGRWTVRWRRLGADPRPSLYACALAAATAESHGGRDQPDGYQEPQQQRDPLDAEALAEPAPRAPAGVPPFAAGTADSPQRALRELLAHRHLLARCQPGERAQQHGQPGVRNSETVPDRVQGPLLPRVWAHHCTLHRLAPVARTGPAWTDGGAAEGERDDCRIHATTKIIIQASPCMCDAPPRRNR
jgi:hypothetical protein